MFIKLKMNCLSNDILQEIFNFLNYENKFQLKIGYKGNKYEVFRKNTIFSNTYEQIHSKEFVMNILNSDKFCLGLELDIYFLRKLTIQKYLILHHFLFNLDFTYNYINEINEYLNHLNSNNNKKNNNCELTNYSEDENQDEDKDDESVSFEYSLEDNNFDLYMDDKIIKFTLIFDSENDEPVKYKKEEDESYECGNVEFTIPFNKTLALSILTQLKNLLVFIYKINIIRIFKKNIDELFNKNFKDEDLPSLYELSFKNENNTNNYQDNNQYQDNYENFFRDNY